MHSISFSCFLLLDALLATALEQKISKNHHLFGCYWKSGKLIIKEKKSTPRCNTEYQFKDKKKKRVKSKNECIKMQKTIINASKRCFSLRVTRCILLLPQSLGSTGVDLKEEKPSLADSNILRGKSCILLPYYFSILLKSEAFERKTPSKF